MARQKKSSSSNKKGVAKKGFGHLLQDGTSPFTLGIEKTGSLNKTATGEYSVTQTQSFFYSPELTSDSWVLPKSRQEILKWIRIFFNLEPYIQQITVMHSLYPFSKFDLVVPDVTIKKFYEEMASNGNFNLFDFICQASLSREKFGEAIPFGNMTQDEEPSKDGKKYFRWHNFILLEPELVEIKTDMLSGKKTFEMVPTEEIKALVSSTRPEDQERVDELKKTSPELVNAVMEHRNIKLDDACVSQIARITDPSATRGTSRIQSCFKALILQDWIRLAQSAYAKNYVFPKELWTIGDLASNTMPSTDDLNNWKQLINQSIQSPPFCMDDESRLLTKDGFKFRTELSLKDEIATINPDTHTLEYKHPNNIYEFDYTGEMIHFNTRAIDHMVTPDHRVLVANRNKQDWHIELAKNVKRTNALGLFANWDGKESGDYVSLGSHSIYIDDYLKFAGYFASEGCTVIRPSTHEQGPAYTIEIGQSESSEHLPAIKALMMSLPFNVKEYVQKQYFTLKNGELAKKFHYFRIHSKEVAQLVRDEFGHHSWEKHLPLWIKELKKDKLQIVLDAIMAGDGNIRYEGKDKHKYYNFRSTSHRLIEDVFEIALKLGYSPIMSEDKGARKRRYYSVHFSDPSLQVNSKGKHSLHGSKDNIKKVQYSGIVWCVDVPNHLFIAERNGKACITGNTIIAPPIVHYEPLSVMGKQFPLNAEYDYIQDQLLVGLGVNKNIISGEGPNFGNSKTMALQALVMQYKAVRDKFEDWVINHFFRPIAEKNEFYTIDPATGKKELILPQISWYKSLDIDAQEREQEQFAEFHKEGLISTKTLFSKYPNLDYETERKQLEEERGTIFDKGSKDNRIPAEISKPSGGGSGGGIGGGEEMGEKVCLNQ